MRRVIFALTLILAMLLMAGICHGQSYTPIPTTKSTAPQRIELKDYLGVYDDWSGYAVDRFGNGLGNIPVTLHIMGDDSNHIPYEVYNVTRMSNNSPPYVGYFNFNDVTINLSRVSAPYGYLDAVARTTDNRTLYGRGYNHTLMLGGSNPVGSIVLTANGSGVSPSPVIFTDMHPGPGMNVTVTGHNFTPNGTAILYILNDTISTSTVGEDGNTSWTYTNGAIAPYPIYAVDTATNIASNTITVEAYLNDWIPTPTPTPTPFPTGLCVLLTVCVAALISRGKELS